MSEINQKIKKSFILLVKSYLIFTAVFLVILCFRIFYETPKELKNTGIQGFFKNTAMPNYRKLGGECYYEAWERKVIPRMDKADYEQYMMNYGEWLYNKKGSDTYMNTIKRDCPATFFKTNKEFEKCTARTQKYFYGGK